MIHQKDIYPNAQEVSGFKVGDTVEITRAAESYEHKWKNTWLECMDSGIGATLTIAGVYPRGIKFYGHSFSYPYFVLQKIKNRGRIKSESVDRLTIRSKCELCEQSDT